MSDTLVVYYSQTATTRRLAEIIATATGADLVEIIPDKAYPDDYEATIEQARVEFRDNIRPTLRSAPDDIAAYDTIFVGSPNWYSTYAPPVLAFLEAHDFTGKKLVPFNTNGGGGAGSMPRDLATECPGAEVLKGIFLSGGIDEVRVGEWLQDIGVL